MKKLLTLALLVGFLGVVTGCTAENKPAPKPTTAPAKPSEPEKPKTDDKGKGEEKK